MKTLEEAISAASECLAGVGIEDPRMESEYLLAAFLHVPRARLILDRQEALPAQKVRAFQGWLRERQQRKPLAYVTGEQPFRDLNLNVNASVLVPRPETELLVEQALRVLDLRDHSVVAVDVGTGSGNIALCLSLHPKVSNVIGIDISPEALQVARENAKRVRRGAPLEWIQGDLLNPLKKRQIRADLIVANLPYVRTGEMNALEPELHWEPRLALDGGTDGLQLIGHCIVQAESILRAAGTLLLEIGADQSQEVVTLIERSAGWGETRVFRDLSGHPRIIQTQKKGL